MEINKPEDIFNKIDSILDNLIEYEHDSDTLDERLIEIRVEELKEYLLKLKFLYGE